MMFFKLIIATGMLLSVFCTPQSDTSSTFVASTPCDVPIRSILSIPLDIKADFIRWKMELQASGSFTISLMYGESKPNTLGFIDTTIKNYKGSYTITKTSVPVYLLKGEGINGTLMLAKINENLFHILTNEQQPMVGNGGWSYVLNALQPRPATSSVNTFKISGSDTARKMTFDGRTLCTEFARDHGIPVNPQCIKFKWRLILNRDPKTLEPTTYSARRIVYDITDNTGTWSIRKVDAATQIIQLNPGDPDRSISLLMLDNNVLYFLDKNGLPYVGNADFSFALNRIQ
jgi:hypothetical protein